MSNFIREARYYVIKQKNLTDDQDTALCDLLSGAQIPCTDCVVVEKDLLNYEHTWKTIEHVASGKFCDPYEEIDRLKARVAELVMAVNLACDNAREDDPDVWGKVDRALASDSSASWLLRQKAEKLDEVAKLVLDAGDLATVASIYEGLLNNAASLRKAADEADKAGGGDE